MATDYLGLNQSGEGANAPPDIGGDSYEFENQADREGLQEAHRRNVALGVLAAGLATMGAQPRGWRQRGTLAQALGEGGLAGIQTYGAAEGQLQKALLAKQKMALEAARYNAQLRQTQELRNIQQGTLDERIRQDKANNLLTQQWRDVQIAAQRSTEEHQRIGEGQKAQEIGLTAQLRGIEQQNAATQAGRLGIEAATYNQKFKPFGVTTATQLLQKYKIPNANEIGAVIGNMPTDLAEKQMDLAVKNAKQGRTTWHSTDSEGHIHVLTRDADGNIINDQKIKDWKAEPKGKSAANANREQLRKMSGLPSETGEAPPAVAAPPGVPVAMGTPTPGAIPTAPAVPINPVGGRSMPTVGHKTRMPDGQYHMAGKIYTVKGGKIAKIDDAPSVPTAE